MTLEEIADWLTQHGMPAQAHRSQMGQRDLEYVIIKREPGQQRRLIFKDYHPSPPHIGYRQGYPEDQHDFGVRTAELIPAAEDFTEADLELCLEVLQKIDKERRWCQHTLLHNEEGSWSWGGYADEADQSQIGLLLTHPDLDGIWVLGEVGEHAQQHVTLKHVSAFRDDVVTKLWKLSRSHTMGGKPIDISKFRLGYFDKKTQRVRLTPIEEIVKFWVSN